MKIFIIIMFTVALTIVGCMTQPIPDHSKVPGIVIDHSPAASKKYIGSPSIAILPNGTYIASHDFFGPGSSKNRTRIHRSNDKGETWEVLTDIDGQWWSSLFVHANILYIIGTSKAGGYVVIRRSDDGGSTWTEPSNQSGILRMDGQYHCAPVPVVIHKGRIWRAWEKATGRWGTGFQPFVMSVPVDADFLSSHNWIVSNHLQWGDWEPYSGWLEGNIVITPDNKLVNILRVNETTKGGKAAVVQVSDNGKLISFNDKTDFINFPGGCKKFSIRHDNKSNLYWSLTNWIHPDDVGKWNPERTRNTLALISSKDLLEWSVHFVVLRSTDFEKTGFQYVDWLFEGNDIVAVSRTAFKDGLGGAHNSHDANYLTFHRIKNFRKKNK